MVTRKKLQIITIVCWGVVIIIELLELSGIRL
ncbi:hypothetical protein P869_06515 [Ligilactobacillus ruminis S23]|jgi:hypothetical protein|nr:hypothetical protein P869_06515 [Ligilactobacillus ruminis S23]